VSEQYVAEIQF